MSRKDKLLHRVRRIRGQLNAVEEGIEHGTMSSTTLHTLVACRAAFNSLVMEVFEDCIQSQVVDPRGPLTVEQDGAMREVFELLRSCL